MNPLEQRREQRLQLLDDHIGRALADSERSGELKTARSYGKPLDLGDGYDQTPPELRMGYKILKDAGVVPAEVELMREIESTNALMQAEVDADKVAALQRRLADQRQQLALRLERLRVTGAI